MLCLWWRERRRPMGTALPRRLGKIGPMRTRHSSRYPSLPSPGKPVFILQLPQKYPTIRRLQPGKLQHLQQLLEFIPNVNQPYLQFIIRKQQELDNTEEDDSTEDEDEDHLEYDSDSEDIVDDPQPLQDEDNTEPSPQTMSGGGCVLR